MGFTSVELTGTYFAPNGGTVQFELNQAMMQEGGLIISPTLYLVTISAGDASTFSISLPATNDPATLPQGVAYEVTEEIVGAPANVYYIILPYNTAFDSIDITECLRVLPTPYPIQSVVLASQMGVPGGFAVLDDSGNVPLYELGNAPTSGGGGGGDSDMPLAGGTFTGPTLYTYSSSSPGTALQSIQLSSDNFPRWELLANAQMQFSSPFAPAIWGTHVNGNVGSGSDFQWGYEGTSDTATMLQLSFPRVHLSDGTHYIQLTAAATFPLSGSPNLTVTSTTGLASSGTLTVDSVYLGNGTITYTSIVNGTTLGGCSSSGLTTNADTSQRRAMTVTDPYGNTVCSVYTTGMNLYVPSAGSGNTPLVGLTINPRGSTQVAGALGTGRSYGLVLGTNATDGGMLLTYNASSMLNALQVQDQNNLPIIWVGLTNNSSAGFYQSLGTYADYLSVIGWWGQGDGVNGGSRGYTFFNRWGSAYFDVGGAARFFGTAPLVLPLVPPGTGGSTYTATTVTGASSFTGSTVYYKMSACNLNGTETIVGPEVSATPSSSQQVKLTLTPSALAASTLFGASFFKVYRSSTSGTYGSTSLLGLYNQEAVVNGSNASIEIVDTGAATTTGTPQTAPAPPPFTLQGWQGEPTTNPAFEIQDYTGATWLTMTRTGTITTLGQLNSVLGATSNTPPTTPGHGFETQTTSGMAAYVNATFANVILSWIISGTATMGLAANQLYPVSDNTLALGNSSQRWSNVAALTLTASTSVGLAATAPTVAGTVATTPPTSATIQTALGNIALGTAYHNTLSYDVWLTVYMTTTAASTVIKDGVGTTTTPTQTSVITATPGAVAVIPVRARIPAGQYRLLSVTTGSGTIVGQYLEAA